MKLEVTTYGNPEAQTLLIQMVDDHDLEGIEKEVAAGTATFRPGRPLRSSAMRISEMGRGRR